MSLWILQASTGAAIAGYRRRATMVAQRRAATVYSSPAAARIGLDSARRRWPGFNWTAEPWRTPAPAAIGADEPRRRARKVGGSYQADGTIVAEFRTAAGELRYVFEFDQPAGMLHIFGPQQLEIVEA